MSIRKNTWFRSAGWLALWALVLQPGLALAQVDDDEGQRLRNGDAIAVTVPGRPALDQTLVLDASGRVALPEVGDVVLVGLTVAEAETVLRNRLRVFYPTLDTIEVELRSSTQVTLYVLGEVRQPGEHVFVAVPSLWDVLRAAGGPDDNADLRMSRIVREDDDGQTVLAVDLSGVFDGSQLPDEVLQDGDTLFVPVLRDGTVTTVGVDGVRVFGAVATPTVVAIDEPTQLVDVLMLAGAPLTDSDLGKVWWVHSTDQRYVSRRVDFRNFLENGDPLSNPLVYPGDTIEVELSRPGWAAQNLPVILGMIATTATVLLAYDRLTNE
ncbi:MAG: hypothetical protein GY838_02890 [bacterium]|nr:hypothetical protein [bacterium]